MNYQTSALISMQLKKMFNVTKYRLIMCQYVQYCYKLRYTHTLAF